ncbi:hypothetical protein VTO42DRAFT_6831 [Malbranchea cinnamomea]
MYSCANYPRGCRGRVNIEGTKCSTCVSLNLRRPSAGSSPFSSTPAYRRPWDVVEKSVGSRDGEKF